MKNNIAVMVLLLILVGALAFFGGMQYQKSKATAVFQGQSSLRSSFAGVATKAEQGFAGQSRRNFQGMRPVSGEIISSDDSSMTLKTADGSTRIIIFSNKTSVNKAASGSKADLKTGENIMVVGTENSDGSVTAQNINIGGDFFRTGSRMNPSPSAK